MNTQSFESLGLPTNLIQNLHRIGYTTMTPIQSLAIKPLLDHKDLIAKAKTGSGKTAAFCIPLLLKLQVKKFRIQSMVLCPTRELATQVANEMRTIAKFQHNVKILTLCGGTPYKPQVHSLSHQAHIIVGTPGRILKHLQEKNFATDDIDTLVLDEADRMLDMGFLEDVEKIISFVPKNRQTMLFSATYPEDIASLAQSIMNEPVQIQTDCTHKQNITQHFFDAKKDKDAILINLLANKKPNSAIIFCNMKQTCEDVADKLHALGCDLLVLHSDYEQKERDEVLTLFANKSFALLIATDVAARGLDIDDVELVINYDLPSLSEIYTHRIGRTARAGKSGEAVSLVDYTKDFELLCSDLDETFVLEKYTNLQRVQKLNLQTNYRAIYINGGKRDKLSKGDILGALTAAIGIPKESIGKIDIFRNCSYIAILSKDLQKALDGLNTHKVKKKLFKAYPR